MWHVQTCHTVCSIICLPVMPINWLLLSPFVSRNSCNICCRCHNCWRVQNVKRAVWFGFFWAHQERRYPGGKQDPRNKKVVCCNKNTFLWLFSLQSARSSMSMSACCLHSLYPRDYRSIVIWSELVSAQSLNCSYFSIRWLVDVEYMVLFTSWEERKRGFFPFQTISTISVVFCIMGMLSCLRVIDDVSKTNFS